MASIALTTPGAGLVVDLPGGLVPKDNVATEVRDIVDPGAHKIAEGRLVQAGACRDRPVGTDLASLRMEGAEPAEGLAAEDLTHTPGIEPDRHSALFRGRDQPAH